jgi:uncharacterized NAD(P)/FAD-binding protein YdhS
MTGEASKHITIGGGGFAGAIFAHHLLRESTRPLAITIVEPRPRLGEGVAYSASEPHQTTNVPAGRMSVHVDDPCGFKRWLEARGAWPEDDEDFYPNRFLFGTYMDDLLRATSPAHPRSRIDHRRVRLASAERSGRGFLVGADDGASWETDVVALATGNPAPASPPALARLSGDPRVILNPWAADALAGVRTNDRLLVLGTSLTMGELIAGLSGHHRGPVVAIARRCRRPERGSTHPTEPFGDFADHRPATAMALLRHFRAEVRRAEAAGLSWRPVAAAVRRNAWPVWQSLSFTERRRFVRHLRPYWEALRHVMPGPVYDLLAEEERRGRLRLLAASLKELESASDGVIATLRQRGAPSGSVMRERFDIVVNCTGPAYATVTETDPFWAAIARSGLVAPDPAGLGIAVDREGRALDVDGVGQPDLVVLGTLARGTFGELTGVPELSRQARDAALALLASWNNGESSIDAPPSVREIAR